MRSLAKITRPSSSGIAPRRRLFRLLDSCRGHSIVWIAGPAGAGKTSLVSSYLDARRLSSLWYQMDEGDADAATFFYYMGEAAKRAAPRRRKALPLLTPEYAQDVPVFALRYFERLFGRLEPATVVVLDNYQDVAKEASLHAVLSKGLAAVPEGSLVFVLSRHMPPPAFARFRAHGQMKVVGWDELRLTLEEAQAVVRARGDRRLRGHGVERAYAMADGWAAGLIMISRSVGAAGGARRAIGRLTREETFDYFGSELFDRTDPETQSFLAKTALLPGMTVRMAQDLTGLVHAGEILARLDASHFFLTRDVQREPVYRYHPLFRDFLLARGQKAWQREEAVRLLDRAATILEGAGQIEAAMALARQVGAWAHFVQLVLRHAAATLAQGRHRTVEAWIRSLPGEVLAGDAWLLYWLGVCRLASDPREGRGYLDRAFALFDTQGDATGRLMAWSAAVESHFYGMDEMASLDARIAWLDEHVPSALQHPDAGVAAYVTVSMVGALLQKRPDHPNIADWMARATHVLHSSANAHLRMRAGTFVAQHDVWRGDFGHLARVAEEMRRISRSPDASPLSLVCWHWCESFAVYNAIEASFEGSLRALEAGLEIARTTGVHVFDSMLLSQGALYSIAAGSVTGARAYLVRLEACSQGPNSLALRLYLAALVALHARDADTALADARESLRLALEVGMRTSVALTRLELAEILASVGRTQEARDQIAQVRAFAQATGYSLLASDCDLVEAHALLEARDPQALRAVASAVSSVRSRNFLSALFWAPASLARLCAAALDAGIEVDFVQRLVRLHRLRLDPPPVHCAAWPWEVRVQTLGRFEITLDGRPLSYGSKAPVKILSLLKALVSFGPGGVSEGRLADLLWPDAEGDSAHQALATSLHRLRLLLGNEEAVRVRDGRVRLDDRCCWVDACAFETLLERATPRRGSGDENLEALEQALALYTGPFLGDATEPWVVSCRERLRSKYLRAVRRLGERHEAAPADEPSALARGRRV